MQETGRPGGRQGGALKDLLQLAVVLGVQTPDARGSLAADDLAADDLVLPGVARDQTQAGIRSMKGDVKRKHFPADGGSWISLASRPCAMESRRSGRRLELDIHAVPLMPTEPGRMQAAGLGLPTMVLSETRGLWLCGVVRGWPRVSPRPAREFARGV